MMGPKKLGTIREELRQAFGAGGDDPVRWLEARMAKSRAQSREVLQYLRDFLKGPRRKQKPRIRRVGGKK
jgi:hypothetical protein